MADVWVVRHGQAAFGTDDYDRLTEIGWAQSRRLGEYFAERGMRFDAVFTGTLRRHRETLAGVFETLFGDSCAVGPGARELPGLNEFDFHTLVTCYRELNPDPAVDVSNPRAFYRCLRDALLAWHRGELDGVEDSWERFEQAVAASLETIGAAGEHVLVVSSGGPISAQIKTVLELSVEHMISLNLQAINTGVTRYVGRPGKLRLNTFNAVPHLERVEHSHLVTYT